MLACKSIFTKSSIRRRVEDAGSVKRAILAKQESLRILYHGVTRGVNTFSKIIDNFLITLRLRSGLSNYLWYCVLFERRWCICQNDVRTGTERSEKDPTVDGKHASSSGTRKTKGRSTNRSSVSRRRRRWRSPANCRRSKWTYVIDKFFHIP